MGIWGLFDNFSLKKVDSEKKFFCTQVIRSTSYVNICLLFKNDKEMSIFLLKQNFSRKNNVFLKTCKKTGIFEVYQIFKDNKS